VLHGLKRYPMRRFDLSTVWKRVLPQCRLGDGTHRCNVVLASIQGKVLGCHLLNLQFADPLQYALRFRVEELFWTASQGRLSWKIRLRSTDALNAFIWSPLALLYGTTQGMVQIQALRQQVDPHWRRGISYLKIVCVGSKAFCTKDAPY